MFGYLYALSIRGLHRAPELQIAMSSDPVITGKEKVTFEDGQEFNQNRLILFVGLVAFGLPVLLGLARETSWFCDYASVSHFYYAPYLGSLLVASLGFIAVAMMSWTGSSPLYRSDRVFAFGGGLGALGVGVFPTEDTGCAYDGSLLARAYVQPPATSKTTHSFQASDLEVAFYSDLPQIEQHLISAGWLHVISAIVLLGAMAYLCLRPFRGRYRNDIYLDAQGRVVHVGTKKTRNHIYLICGLGILGLMGWIGVYWLLNWQDDTYEIPPIFWQEAFALMLFGVAWVVKSKKADGYLPEL